MCVCMYVCMCVCVRACVWMHHIVITTCTQNKSDSINRSKVYP